jgi:hypothetical protein
MAPAIGGYRALVAGYVCKSASLEWGRLIIATAKHGPGLHALDGAIEQLVDCLDGGAFQVVLGDRDLLLVEQVYAGANSE